ncbi:alpha-amylase family protein [Roseinatronobacter sp. S2]|uniref:alpha-amylase family protein n=1 Tax=Roseinatronobacter sp. S2 TaxID=3035471 RepID=UPI00240F2C44|nr:alpha-amylase family protein [Roseinatronobacter sp. S2]WFE76717.1 family 10 glycosylhydrolase [Roseinatronobacter sp. S2]
MRDVREMTSPTLRQPDWYRTATRWTQLTLAEDDPIKFNPAEWIDIFRRTRSNATCLSAGGYVAYYPSKVPLHYVSKFIGDNDPFGELVNGARELGMHVMARVDPHAIHQDAADAHPEWIAVDAEGNPRRHWAFPEAWVTCAYGDYNAKFMPEVVKELVRNYDIDAVFANRWQGHGICYCDSCKSRFHAATGLDLPRTTSTEDPAWRAWSAWRRDVLTRMVVAWDNDVRAIRPHASFIPNMGGASLMEFDLELIEKHCPFLVVDHQGRHGSVPVWTAGRNAKRMRATFRDRPAILITSVGPEEPVHRWKDSVNSGAETEAWITDGAMHGMLPWFTKFNGVVPDPRWIEPVARGFALHERIEPALASTQPATEIAILDATTTLRRRDWNDRQGAEADELGFYHALVEAGLPFEFVSDHAMTPDMLDRFRVLILPNATCLSDDQCAMLRDWTTRGGSLVVAGESATCDEHGVPRSELGLGDVLGTTMTAAARGPLKNTYVALNGDHPVAMGFGGAARIIGGTRTMAVTAEAGTDAPFLYIPDFPDLPMEEVYPRAAPVTPAVVARDTGAGGRTVHIPWNVGATFWEVLTEDHQRLIENAVRWALGNAPSVEVLGDAVLDVAAREGDGVTLVMLTNLTNPMMMKGPIRRVYPVSGQRVRATLPAGRSGATARLLVADTEVDVSVQDSMVEIQLPEIALAEVVRIDWY